MTEKEYLENIKDAFGQIVDQRIERKGISDLLFWLENETDFFTAPASTRFHGAYAGGLAMHSIHVCQRLIQLCRTYNIGNKVSIAIVSLFHDVCKANFYGVEMRNRKNEETGRWEKVPFYTIQDQFPAGHGEKSVMLIQRFMQLTDEEIMAINWHMGFSDARAQGYAGMNAVSAAFEKYPLALLLHFADMQATYWDEKTNPEEE